MNGFYRIYPDINAHFRDETVDGVEALVLSFLTQLDTALKPKTTTESGTFLAQPKPKIELQIANRTKQSQDGYTSALPSEFLI